jgi:hypothetical protein
MVNTDSIVTSKINKNPHVKTQPVSTPIPMRKQEREDKNLIKISIFK